jgi:hypothetical protein
VAEQRIAALLQEKLYTPEGVQRLVDTVNARLRDRQSGLAAESERVLSDLAEIGRRLDGLRRFVEQGDTSAKVREWLRAAEEEEAGLKQALKQLSPSRQPHLQVHPQRIERYLANLHGTLLRGGTRARQLLQEDVERIVVHRVRDAAKPFARAEVVTTGKGLLDRVAFMVAGAGFEPATFGL